MRRHRSERAERGEGRGASEPPPPPPPAPPQGAEASHRERNGDRPAQQRQAGRRDVRASGAQFERSSAREVRERWARRRRLGHSTRRRRRRHRRRRRRAKRRESGRVRVAPKVACEVRVAVRGRGAVWEAVRDRVERLHERPLWRLSDLHVPAEVVVLRHVGSGVHLQRPEKVAKRGCEGGEEGVDEALAHLEAHLVDGKGPLADDHWMVPGVLQEAAAKGASRLHHRLVWRRLRQPVKGRVQVQVDEDVVELRLAQLRHPPPQVKPVEDAKNDRDVGAPAPHEGVSSLVVLDEQWPHLVLARRRTEIAGLVEQLDAPQRVVVAEALHQGRDDQQRVVDRVLVPLRNPVAAGVVLSILPARPAVQVQQHGHAAIGRPVERLADRRHRHLGRRRKGRPRLGRARVGQLRRVQHVPPPERHPHGVDAVRRHPVEVGLRHEGRQVLLHDAAALCGADVLGVLAERLVRHDRVIVLRDQPRAEVDALERLHRLHRKLGGPQAARLRLASIVRHAEGARLRVDDNQPRPSHPVVRAVDAKPAGRAQPHSRELDAADPAARSVWRRARRQHLCAQRRRVARPEGARRQRADVDAVRKIAPGRVPREEVVEEGRAPRDGDEAAALARAVEQLPPRVVGALQPPLLGELRDGLPQRAREEVLLLLGLRPPLPHAVVEERLAGVVQLERAAV
mmetsp:Transcript_12601/g.41775  ORF Transcript_12601/g.41775 Transcript_12601/m.41775 type:complete len:683 (+) Transcript_12601:574-2622(+)